MSDILQQLDAVAKLHRKMQHPGGIPAENQAFTAAAREIDHATIAAALRAKDAEIKRLTELHSKAAEHCRTCRGPCFCGCHTGTIAMDTGGATHAD